MKKAFTMIELVFVIVILGILSSVAFPKLSSYIEDANTAVGTATISSIRSAIVTERQRSLIKGVSTYPLILDDAVKDVAGESLFDGNASISILQYGIKSGNESGDWMKTSDNGASITYKYYIGTAKVVTFTYTNADGKFDCDHSEENCQLLTE